VIAEIVVEFEDFRTGNSQSAKRPGDEQTLVSGAVVNRRQKMEEESPAIPVIGPRPDNVGLFGFPCVGSPRLAAQE
jgi:hypothetical protein